MGYREKSATLDHSVTYTYDAENNLSSMVETVNGVSKTYSYTYDTDNRLISMSVGDATVSYTYDDFGRVSKRTTKHGETVIEETDVGYNSTASTTSGQIVSYNDYSYTYDQNGNITYYGDGRRDENFFQYDSQNQIIRAESYDLGYIWIWEYDNAGNILSRTMYDFFDTGLVTPLETVSYEYNDSEWGDLLTAYDGKTITYDANGNPLNDGTWSYTWQHGRQLASMTSGDTTWTYTYNADGLRTKRTDGLSSYTYIYDGDKLTRLIVESYENFDFSFTYDSNGTPLTITDQDQTYYYVSNLQGDVIGIKDSAGNQVVTYSYDAWGNLLYRTNTQLADYNPLRYRGYVYDHETGLYYLQSRYYNPELGRFINADDISMLGASGTASGYNLFTYCVNNPVNKVDIAGYAAINVIFAAVGAVVGWPLGDFVAKKLGYYSGWKYWTIRAGVVVGGAVIGWFAGSLMAKIIASYLKNNPGVIFKITNKLGATTFHSAMKLLGINPFSLAKSSSQFIALARLFNTKAITISYDWAVKLYNLAKSFGYNIITHTPHGEYSWHIHISGGNGKLSNLHIQIAKSAWDYISKLLK